MHIVVEPENYASPTPPPQREDFVARPTEPINGRLFAPFGPELLTICSFLLLAASANASANAFKDIPESKA